MPHPRRYYFGQTPCNENCAQVGTEGYDVIGRREAETHMAQLYRFLETKGRTPRDRLPIGFAIEVSEEMHDFGVYYEVVCVFPDNGCTASWELLGLLEESAPDEWDDESRKALGLV